LELRVIFKALPANPLRQRVLGPRGRFTFNPESVFSKPRQVVKKHFFLVRGNEKMTYSDSGECFLAWFKGG
jgi:hypothetical protein